MTDKMIKKPLTLALGTAFVLGTASSVFAANDLLRGYESGSADRMELLAGGHGGGDKKDKEEEAEEEGRMLMAGGHGGEKKDEKEGGEGKCGEGKCGESKCGAA
jgi:hypothetical protein